MKDSLIKRYDFEKMVDINTLTNERIREYLNRTGGFYWHDLESSNINWYNVNPSITVPFIHLCLGLVFLFVAMILTGKYWIIKGFEQRKSISVSALNTDSYV